MVRIFSIWTKYGEIKSISLRPVKMQGNTDQDNFTTRTLLLLLYVLFVLYMLYVNISVKVLTD